MEDSEIAVYKQVFEKLDADGDGAITVDDLKQVLAELGYRLNDDQIQSIIDEADADEDGSISWDEFIDVVGSKPKFDRETAHMRRLFKTFDVDNTGFISAENVKEVLDECELEVDEEKIDALMASLDTDEDGQISYEEFVEMVEQTGSSDLKQMATEDQPQEEPEELAE